MNIVFFGTSEFGVIILEKLAQTNLKPVLVVTTSDMPSGRKLELAPPPVKISAQKLGIPVLQSDSIQNTKYQILNTRPDLFIVASYGKILPKEILDIPRYGALNVHPSLLPKYRGPSPVQNAILNGDKETGVTIMLLDEEVDHGPILTNYKLQITNNKYAYAELHDKLAKLGAELLIQTIPEWVAGKMKSTPQDHSLATYTKILKREDGKIHWNNSAEYIERQMRAFAPWPGTYAFCNSKSASRATARDNIIKILKADIFETSNETQRKFGQVFLTEDKKLAIQTKENALIVEELQLEGKKPTSAKDFLLGHKNFIGAILC